MSCTFNVSSLFSEVSDTITNLPKDPKELKTTLMAHLGISASSLSLESSCVNDNTSCNDSGTGTCGGSSRGNECCFFSSSELNSNITKPKISSEISNVFKHPITYIDPSKLHELSSSIIDDLEMVYTKSKTTNNRTVIESSNNDINIDTDVDNVKGLYHYVFKPTSVYGNEYLPIWSKYYSTDLEYLKNTQTLLNVYDTEILNQAIAQYTAEKTCDDAFSSMKNTWTSFRGSGKIGDFKEKFSYVETPILSKLNQSSSFLQFLTVYNISSPVIALITPIIILIVPFFVLMMRGMRISVSDYIDILKTIISQHSIGKILTDFDTVSIEQKMYILMSIIFYCIQIYQNIMACIRFYNNIKLVHTHLNTINGYLTATGVNMTYMIQLVQTYRLKSYEGFKKELLERYTLLTDFTRALTDITPFSPSISKFLQIGYVMKNYYALFSQTDLNELLEYSFGFNAYMEHLSACRSLVINGNMNACEFVTDDNTIPPVIADAADAAAAAAADDAANATDTHVDETDSSGNEITDSTNNNGSPTISTTEIRDKPIIALKSATRITSQIYAPLLSKSAVSNDIHLNKQLIITGPNAAGKTTIIKTTLFNIILSQQLGFGFYKKAQINPYEHLHCYLNIPDTSGRDSLFQAESRRCKEILTCMLENPNKRHFCIFDELYSGTNPYEAIASAYGYIEFVSKKPNVDLILTTHYIELCELLSKHDRIENLHMSTSEDGVYLYKIADGISTIKGGLKVLRDLDYPTEIVNNAMRIIERKN